MATVPAARQLAVPLRAALIRYPALPLAVVAVVTLLWFAASNGGYDGTTWYPGTLIFLALFVMAVITLPAPGAPNSVWIAVIALFAYAAWSYLSIGWADQKGDAWDGANRSLLYALAFALFALWRPRGRIAVALLIAYSVGVAGVGLIELLRASGAAHPADFFIEGRFASPAGYMNANVALWFSALWPCVALGARRELHPLSRGCSWVRRAAVRAGGGRTAEPGLAVHGAGGPSPSSRLTPQRWTVLTPGPQLAATASWLRLCSPSIARIARRASAPRCRTPRVCWCSPRSWRAWIGG